MGRSDRSAPRAEVPTAAKSAATEATAPSRAQRRKAQTRQQLLAAARTMLADGTAPDASIQQITETADLGFGTFYNHFTSKTELFKAAVTDVLEELGDLFDRLNTDVEDPALAYAQATRLTLRLCRSRPQVAAVFVRHGMDYLEAERGVAPRLLRDLEAGLASGRFLDVDPRLARAALSGAVLATLHIALTDPELVDDAACDRLVEQLLRMLGVPFDDARELAHAPLPDADLPESS